MRGNVRKIQRSKRLCDTRGDRGSLWTTLKEGPHGARVTARDNGHAALSLIATGLRPDLLVTDVVLPDGLNGFELAAQVRERLPGIRLLLTSGYAQNLVANRPPSVATVPLLHKPFHRAELAHHVRRALDAG